MMRRLISVGGLFALALALLLSESLPVQACRHRHCRQYCAPVCPMATTGECCTVGPAAPESHAIRGAVGNLNIAGFYWMYCDGAVYQLCDGTEPPNTKCFLLPFAELGAKCSEHKPPRPTAK